MSYQKFKAAYKRDGHLVVRQFLTPDEFQELSDNVGRYIRDVVPGLPPTKAFYQDPEKPETLKQLQEMEELVHHLNAEIQRRGAPADPEGGAEEVVS